MNCLITGASRGLGRAIAIAFWNEGANLILVSRSEAALHAVAAELLERPKQRALLLPVELSAASATDQIVCEAKKVFQNLDVLVNNAAVQGPIGPLWTNAWDAWQRTLDVNLLAPVALCRACIPWMAEQRRGKIINISGGGASKARPNFSAYATSKTALVRFTETLAEETRGLRIDVNCVAPGIMNTEMLADVLAHAHLVGPDECEQARVTRSGGPTDFKRTVDLCLFLASRDSDGITGKLISSKWDPWENLPTWRTELQETDIYTLRRITPEDRGKKWP